MAAETVDPRTFTRAELLEYLRSTPTVSVEFAGACCSLSRAAAYRAAEAGQLKVLRLGRRLLVPSAWLEAALMLDGDGHDSPVLPTGEPVSHGPCAGISQASPRVARDFSADGAP